MKGNDVCKAYTESTREEANIIITAVCFGSSYLHFAIFIFFLISGVLFFLIPPNYKKSIQYEG